MKKIIYIKPEATGCSNQTSGYKISAKRIIFSAKNVITGGRHAVCTPTISAFFTLYRKTRIIRAV